MKRFNFKETYLFEGFFDDFEDDLEDDDTVVNQISDITSYNKITVEIGKLAIGDKVPFNLNPKTEIRISGINYQEKDYNIRTNKTIDITDTINEFGFIKFSNNIKNIVIDFLWCSNLYSTAEMFEYNSILETVNFINFRTDNLTQMNSMFEWCTALRNVNLHMIDTSKVTTMERMFLNCTTLVTLDLSSFDTSNVKTTENMFNQCKKLYSLILGENFKLQSDVNCHDMFKHCNNLMEITCTDEFKQWVDTNIDDLNLLNYEEINWKIIE